MTETVGGLANETAVVNPIPVGHVLSVRGSTVDVCLPQILPSGGKRATVGKFLTITAGAAALSGVQTSHL